MKYVYVKAHAGTLASGQPVAPGETVELEDSDVALAHNQRLIGSNALQLIPEKPKRKAAPKPKRKAAPSEENVNE